MTDPADPRQLDGLLARHRIRARHALGQNFLVDPAVRDRIADAAGLREDDQVLEVGAGPGSLTVALAPRCRRLVAVEFDRRVLPLLREVVAGREGVEVLQADVLSLDLEALFPGGGEVVAGNIPYNITGALFRRLLGAPHRPRRLSFVVQKEVARRLTRPGDWSLASVAVNLFADPVLEFEIPAAAFDPPPRVGSALVTMEVLPAPRVALDDPDGFLRFVESVFQFRRKQLGAALGRVSGAGGAAASERLRSLGVEPSRRAQSLSIAEWAAVHGRFRS